MTRKELMELLDNCKKYGDQKNGLFAEVLKAIADELNFRQEDFDEFFKGENQDYQKLSSGEIQPRMSICSTLCSHFIRYLTNDEVLLPEMRYQILLEQIQAIYLYKGRCMQMVAGNREEEVFIEHFPKLLRATGLLKSEYLKILEPMFPTLTIKKLDDWAKGEDLPYNDLRAGLFEMLVEHIEKYKFGIQLVRR